MATDRERVLRNVFGDLAKVPPGPLSQVWWIWDPEIRELPYDSGQAARLLTRTGWTDSDGDGMRDKDGRPLAFRLLLPTTSAVRRQYARLLQEQFRIAGVDVQLDEVDFSLYNERARAGRFDALLNVWNTDPTPSSGFPQTWTPAGFGRSNYGRYDNPEVDRLVDQAVASAANRDQARRAWRAAVETLNRDAPGIFLFATSNVAAVPTGRWATLSGCTGRLPMRWPTRSPTPSPSRSPPCSSTSRSASRSGSIRLCGRAGSATWRSATSRCSSTPCRCSGWGWSCCSSSRSGSAGSPRAGSPIPSCVPGSIRRTACSFSSGTSHSPPSRSGWWARRARRATSARRCARSP